MVTFVLLALRQLSGELADPFGQERAGAVVGPVVGAGSRGCLVFGLGTVTLVWWVEQLVGRTSGDFWQFLALV